MVTSFSLLCRDSMEHLYAREVHSSNSVIDQKGYDTSCPESGESSSCFKFFHFAFFQ